MLELKNIHISYKNNLVLHDINIQFNLNTCNAIIGKNGSGKSSLLKTISGIIPASKGNIYYNNKDKSNTSVIEWSNYIAYLPSKVIFPLYHTVDSFIQLGIKSNNPTNQNFEYIIHLLNLSFLLKKPLHTLSDGQKQKVLIAQILVRETPYLVLDEPLTYLDFDTKNELIELFIKLVKEKNKTIIFSTHDLHLLDRDIHILQILNGSLLNYAYDSLS